MINKPLLLVMSLAAAGCSSSTPQNMGSATTVLEQPLFSLKKNDDSLVVYETKAWELVSGKACKFVKGELAEADMEKLRGLVNDASLKKASKECADDGFHLTVKLEHACWGVDKTGNAAMDGITAFWNEKYADLDKAPQGTCSNKPLETGPVMMRQQPTDPAPPGRGSAGSGG